MVVSASGTISDLNVSVDISHTFVGDLAVTLTHLDTGTSVTIIDHPGSPASQFGCSEDNIVATLDDEAASPVEDQCASSTPTIAGTFIPNNPLSAFDGESIGGTWRLTVFDWATLDVGTLNMWCLLPTTGPADSDDDGVPDDQDNCPETPADAVVNAEGCAIVQLCPCEDAWKNRGAYVRCVARAAEDFVVDGLITEAEKDAIVSEAGGSSCGNQ